MKNSFLRWSLVSSITALFLTFPCNRVEPCFYYPEPDQISVMFFNPGVSDDSIAFRPFYLSYAYYFPSSPQFWDAPGFESDTRQDSIDYRRNCLEWRQYLGGDISVSDIYQVVYSGKADVFMTAYATHSLQTQYPGNTFIRALQKPDNKAALDYLNFAKTLEFQQSESMIDPWAESWPNSYAKGDSQLLAKLDYQSTQGLTNAQNDFLKHRWAYQRIQLLYYQHARHSDSSIQAIYKQHFNISTDHTILSPWALLKVAETNPDTTESTYQLAQVFDRCASKRKRVLQLFAPHRVEAALRLAQNPHERALLLSMRLFRNPGKCLPTLEQIAKEDPESPYLPLLLTREINKLENWLLTSKFTGENGWYIDKPDFEWDENYDHKLDKWIQKHQVQDREYVTKLQHFTSETLGKQKQKTTVWQLALAHLQYMNGDFDQAWNTLESINPGQNLRWKLQLFVQELLVLPHRTDVRQSAIQAELVRRLEFIRAHGHAMITPEKQLARLHLALCHAFWKQNDIVSAGLFYGRACPSIWTKQESYASFPDVVNFFDNLASEKDLEKLVKVLQNPQNPLEKYLTSPFAKIEGIEYLFNYGDLPLTPWPSLDQLYELMGMFAMRNGDVNHARQAYALVDTAYWNNIHTGWNEDIFGSTELIASDTLPPGHINRLEIAEKMVQLEQEAINNRAKSAENYYLLGNAWYHCSYWGKACNVLARYRSTNDKDMPPIQPLSPTFLSWRPNVALYGQVYFHCSRAAEYYRKALEASTSPELATRAYYMLAECDRRSRWMKFRRSEKNSNREGEVASPMFRTWSRRYKHTEAYKEILSYCPGLQAYLGK